MNRVKVKMNARLKELKDGNEQSKSKDECKFKRIKRGKRREITQIFILFSDWLKLTESPPFFTPQPITDLG